MQYNVASRTLYKAIISLGAVSAIHTYIIDWCPAHGSSMKPLIDTTDNILLYERISGWGIFNRFKLRQGDVVIAQPDKYSPYIVCKRITSVKEKIMKVHEHGIQHVPVKRYYWLEGDNVENSSDSRDFGYLPENQILGRVVCKIWPPRKIGWIFRK